MYYYKLSPAHTLITYQYTWQLTKISLKLPGIPVSLSNTNRTPSGGLLTKSRTSRATRANVRGGKFSELLLPLLEFPPVVIVLLLPDNSDVPVPEEDKERVEESSRDGLLSPPCNNDDMEGVNDVVVEVEEVEEKREAE